MMKKIMIILLLILFLVPTTVRAGNKTNSDLYKLLPSVNRDNSKLLSVEVIDGSQFSQEYIADNWVFFWNGRPVYIKEIATKKYKINNKSVNFVNAHIRYVEGSFDYYGFSLPIPPFRHPSKVNYYNPIHTEAKFSSRNRDYLNSNFYTGELVSRTGSTSIKLIENSVNINDKYYCILMGWNRVTSKGELDIFHYYDYLNSSKNSYSGANLNNSNYKKGDVIISTAYIKSGDSIRLSFKKRIINLMATINMPKDEGKSFSDVVSISENMLTNEYFVDRFENKDIAGRWYYFENKKDITSMLLTVHKYKNKKLANEAYEKEYNNKSYNAHKVDIGSLDGYILETKDNTVEEEYNFISKQGEYVIYIEAFFPKEIEINEVKNTFGELVNIKSGSPPYLPIILLVLAVTFCLIIFMMGIGSKNIVKWASRLNADYLENYNSKVKETYAKNIQKKPLEGWISRENPDSVEQISYELDKGQVFVKNISFSDEDNADLCFGAGVSQKLRGPQHLEHNNESIDRAVGRQYKDEGDYKLKYIILKNKTVVFISAKLYSENKDDFKNLKKDIKNIVNNI